MQERNGLDAQVTSISEMTTELGDLIEFAGLAFEEKDEDSLDEAQRQLEALHARAAMAESEALLSGEADSNNCFLEVHAGAGGTESNDWAGM